MESYYTLKNYPNVEEIRIKKLRIPPNWKDVRISKDSGNKVQVTGIDAKNRKQYIYHPVWILFSKESKYLKIDSLNFNKFTKVVKEKSKENSKEKSKENSKEKLLSKDYIIANMFILMKDLNIRVGNEIYLKDNDSTGLCTMQKSNYSIKDGSFNFKGKRGIIHVKKLSKEHIIFINKLISIPGKYVFQYIENNHYCKIMAADLNEFLKKYVDENMTCKDIRTYSANKIFSKKYKELLKKSDPKARINAIKYTAEQLGNTPKVCRDSYINPELY